MIIKTTTITTIATLNESYPKYNRLKIRLHYSLQNFANAFYLLFISISNGGLNKNNNNWSLS